MALNFTSPGNPELKPRITVIGVGGAGCNAVNNMIASNLEGVDFIVANTDAQALEHSRTERRIQLGASTTQGLGAGSRPEVGRAAAEEAMDEILSHLAGAHMVFITAGMGGGTGTGAAPVIARFAREQGILTVGVVTKPFRYEGNHRSRIADAGISEFQKYVDTLIVIPNQNLFRVATEKTTFADAFKMADDVLYCGVRGVTDLIVKPGLVNLDFADIRSVMAEMGKAHMGTGEASGDNRAIEAANRAISNPLLDDTSMRGAKGVLINITGGYDITLYEVDEAANRIREEVDPEANIIFGSTFDEALEGKVRISVVATGIECEADAKSPTHDAFISNIKHRENLDRDDLFTVPEPRGTVQTLRPQYQPQPQMRTQVQVVAQPEAQPAAVMSAEPEAVAQVEIAPPLAQVARELEQSMEMPVAKAEPVMDTTAALAKVHEAARQAAERVEPRLSGLRAGMKIEAKTEPKLAAPNFIPPAPAEIAPTPRQAEPFAQAAVENAKPVAPAIPAKRHFSLFKWATQPAAETPKTEPSMTRTVVAEPTVQRPAPQLSLDPKPRAAASPRTDEDMLDIPAFLRRQAN